METLIQQKDQEMGKKNVFMTKLTRQHENIKNQLHSANLKIKQMGQNIVGDLNAKIKEKEKESVVLKEMLKASNLQVKGIVWCWCIY